MITQAALFFQNNFPEVIDNIKKFVEDLPTNLKILRYKESPELYIAKGIVLTLLVFAFSTTFLNILMAVLSQSVSFSLTLSLLFSAVLSFVFFILYLRVPSFRASSLASAIDRELHESLYVFGVFVNDKTPLQVSIKNFVSSNPNYKLSKELNDVLKLMEFGGLDILSAIDKKIELTPSKKLTRFLFGLSTTIKGGGSIKTYVSNFAKDEIEEYRNKVRDAGRKIGMVLQIYMIIILVGAMFLNIIISIFSLLQPMEGIVETQFLISILLVPISSYMMARLIRLMIP